MVHFWLWSDVLIGEVTVGLNGIGQWSSWHLPRPGALAPPWQEAKPGLATLLLQGGVLVRPEAAPGPAEKALASQIAEACWSFVCWVNVLLILALLSHTGLCWLSNTVWRDCRGRLAAPLCCLCCTDPWGREQIWAENMQVGKLGLSAALPFLLVLTFGFGCGFVLNLESVSGKLELYSKSFLVIT